MQITKTTLRILPHPHAHTPAQTQNTQSSPPHADPPTLQVDKIQLQWGGGVTIIHWAKKSLGGRGLISPINDNSLFFMPKIIFTENIFQT